MARTRKTACKSTGPFGVPRHQLAPRHEGSSSGSNDPISVIPSLQRREVGVYSFLVSFFPSFFRVVRFWGWDFLGKHSPVK
jgi:hypothetical protein